MSKSYVRQSDWKVEPQSAKPARQQAIRWEATNELEGENGAPGTTRKSRGPTLLTQLGRLPLTGGFVLILFMACSNRNDPAKPESAEASANAKKFFHEATNEFEPVKLLQWGQKIFADTNIHPGLLPRSSWPDYLTAKTNRFGRPTYVNLRKENDGKSGSIRIDYAGGFGLMGIAIIPSKEPIVSTDQTVFIPWSEGVYIYNSP